MNGLAVLFAIVMGVAALFGVTLFAALATWLLAEMFDVIARARDATDLAALYGRLRALLEQHHQKVFARPLLPEELHTLAVSICVEPLGRPRPTAYVVGINPRDHAIIFSDRKHDARVLHDLLAVKSWMLVIEDRTGRDPFVVVAPRGDNR